MFKLSKSTHMAIFNSTLFVSTGDRNVSEVAGCWPHSDTREECDNDEGMGRCMQQGFTYICNMLNRIK